MHIIYRGNKTDACCCSYLSFYHNCTPLLNTYLGMFCPVNLSYTWVPKVPR